MSYLFVKSLVFLMLFTGLFQQLLFADEIDYAEMTLEDLMNISITSVSKREEQLSTSAAAVHVITAEEIAQRGATTVPEALKLIPGVLVSQINATLYEVSIRGFRNRFMNKLLVLVDGRSIYTPFFSGVYWEFHHLPIAEIERIETIRGPGASLWGSNAVNGVINIITKSANSTNGKHKVLLQGGNQENSVTVQSSPAVSQSFDARFYGHFLERKRSGSEFSDRWKIARGGSKWTYRWSETITSESVLEVMESEYYQPSQFAIFQPPFAIIDSRPTKSKEWFFNHKIEGQLGDNQLWSMRAIVNHRDRNEVGALDETRTIHELIWQHEINWHNSIFVWGMGYRKDKDEFNRSPYVWVDPDNATLESYNAFLQGQVELSDNKVVTLGTKWEDDPVSGEEWQPTVRFSWQLNENNLFWAAVSKAVQTPSRALTDLNIIVSVFPGELPGPPSFGTVPAINALVLAPTERTRSEELMAWELGFRQAFLNQFTVDSTLFYSDYDDIRYSELDFANPAINILEPVPHNEIYFIRKGGIKVSSFGFESLVRWRCSEEIEFNLGYSFIDFSYKRANGSTFNETLAEESTPTHQAFIEMNHRFSSAANLNLSVRYVDSFKEPMAAGDVLQNANVFADMAVTLGLAQNVKLQIVGNNLFDSETQQTISNAGIDVSTEVPRAGRVSLLFDF